MFTKQHYEAIAAIIRGSTRPDGSIDGVSLEAGLISFFKNDNPLFDRERFLAACRPSSATKAPSHRTRKPSPW